MLLSLLIPTEHFPALVRAGNFGRVVLNLDVFVPVTQIEERASANAASVLSLPVPMSCLVLFPNHVLHVLGSSRWSSRFFFVFRGKGKKDETESNKLDHREQFRDLAVWAGLHW